MIGHPVHGLMIVGLQIQDGVAREIILLGWWCPVCLLLSIRHTLFCFWAVHDQFDRDQQQKDYRYIFGITV